MNPTDNSDNSRVVPSRRGDDSGKAIRIPVDPKKEFKEVMREREREGRPRDKVKKSVERDSTDGQIVEEVFSEEEETPPSMLALASTKSKPGPSKKSPESKLIAENDSKSPYTPVEGRSRQKGYGDEQDAAQQQQLANKAEPTSKESPFSLYKKVASKTKEAPRPFAVESMSQNESDQARPSRSVSQKNEKQTMRYQEEQADLAYVNPLGGPTTAVAGVSDSSTGVYSVSKIAELKDLVDKLVDKLYVLQKKGGSDTIVEVNLPNNVFDKARVIVTSFDSASKEFNLAFENLRPDAKNLIDKNMTQLRSNLEEKGFANVIHIITTTTEIERPLPSDSQEQQFARGNREGNKEKEQKEKRQG